LPHVDEHILFAMFVTVELVVVIVFIMMRLVVLVLMIFIVIVVVMLLTMMSVRPRGYTILVIEPVECDADIAVLKNPRGANRLRVRASAGIANNTSAFGELFHGLGVCRVEKHRVESKSGNFEIITFSIDAVDVPSNLSDRSLEKADANLLITYAVMPTLEHAFRALGQPSWNSVIDHIHHAAYRAIAVEKCGRAPDHFDAIS
jgi:ABC-type multidrug transport system fused ATPase/permease subunit